jgi:hypothetical protein
MNQKQSSSGGVAWLGTCDLHGWVQVLGESGACRTMLYICSVLHQKLSLISMATWDKQYGSCSWSGYCLDIWNQPLPLSAAHGS